MARVAVTGAAGQLGRQLVARYAARGHVVLPMRHAEFDIASPSTARALIEWAPDLVVNAAAWTDVDGCARDPDRAMSVNGEAPGALAAAAGSVGARFVQISTNEVFDGTTAATFGPDDRPRPINSYGASKLRGEQAISAAMGEGHLIVRTAWLFGPGGSNFVTKILAAARAVMGRGERMRVVADEIGNPTWTPALADRIVELTSGPAFVAPIAHVVGTPPVSRFDWAQVALAEAALDVPVDPVPLRTFRRASRPPLHAVLEPSAGMRPIDWREATAAYVAQLERGEA